MKKYFLLLDKRLTSIIGNLTGMLLVLLTIITFVQVIFRYVLEMPIGGWGEVPTFLMIACVWLAAVLNLRRNTHLTIKIMDLIIKNKKIYKYIQLIVRFLTLLTLLIFTHLSITYLQYIKESGGTTPGLRFPQWWLISILLFSSLLMLIYTIKNFSEELKEIKEISK